MHKLHPFPLNCNNGLITLPDYLMERRGFGGKHRKYIIWDLIRSTIVPPMIIGLQELKSSSFLTTIAMNTIASNYLRVVAKANDGKEGAALLHHPSLNMINLGTLNLGKAAWAQFLLDTMTISMAVVYAPRDLARARALL